MPDDHSAASTVALWQDDSRLSPAPEQHTGASRSLATRLLHGSILVSVVFQLIGSNFLSRPLPGEALDLSTAAHEYVGMVSLGLVLVFWIWSLIRHGETSLGRLVPWLSVTRFGAVLRDLQSQIGHLLRGEVPDDADGALASSIHGLGLLALTAVAATGTAFFFAHGTTARTLLSMHKLVSNLMWAYLIGHASIAVLHHLLGSDIFSRMFWRRSRSPARRSGH